MPFFVTVTPTAPPQSPFSWERADAFAVRLTAVAGRHAMVIAVAPAASGGCTFGVTGSADAATVQGFVGAARAAFPAFTVEPV